MANSKGAALERVNLMLDAEGSAWMDQLAEEIRVKTGARVSRSEITRAALAMLRELHRLAGGKPAGIPSLSVCKSEGDLIVLGTLAIRKAVAT